jgi:AcrR family transcriptional regulator
MPKKTAVTITRSHERSSVRPAIADGSATAGEPKKSDVTRQRILDAAAMVMSREGFAGTKLSDIAAAAQTKIATLYYYFASREELVQAVLITGSEQVRLHTDAALAACPLNMTPLDRLCVAVEAHLRYILQISHYTEAAIRNSGQVPEQIKEALRVEQARYGRLWRDLVDAAAVGTEFQTSAQRRTVHMLIVGGLNWTVEWWTEARAPLEVVVKTALHMTRSAFAGSPAPAPGRRKAT